MKSYFKKYRYQSISSKDFVSFFQENFSKVEDKVNFDEWLYGVGHCPNLAPTDSSLVDAAAGLARNWFKLLSTAARSGEDAESTFKENIEVNPSQFQAWDPKQKLCFLSEFRAVIDSAIEQGTEDIWDARAASLMDTMYNMSNYRNSEIRFAWCRLALIAGYSKIIGNVKEFLSSQGRMKFVRPLFNDLHKVYPKGSFAKDYFAEVKDSYHSIALKMIEKDLSTEQK